MWTGWRDRYPPKIGGEIMDLNTAQFVATVVGIVVTGMLGFLALVVQIVVAITKK